MKRSVRSKTGISGTVILLGIGAAAAIYLLWSRTASAAAGPGIGTGAGGTLSPPAVSQREYDGVKAQVLDAAVKDGRTGATQVELDNLTQAYLRGDRTELTGLVNYLHGMGETNLASLLAWRLDQVNAAPAVSGW